MRKGQGTRSPFPAGEHVVGISAAAAGGAGSWVSPESFSA